MSARWRLVLVMPDGRRQRLLKGSFASSEAASQWVVREQLRARHAGCDIEVEPDILAVGPR